MNRESQKVMKLFDQLCKQPKRPFPQYRQSLVASSKPGVYIIRKDDTVLHVGRTLRGRDGLNQRLKNHIHGSSSFTNEYLKGNGAILRGDGYTYQYIVVEDPRKRALVEAYAIGKLCPAHIGLGGSPTNVTN
jgi:excinuclease UvrABC nuclease subunit